MSSFTWPSLGGNGSGVSIYSTLSAFPASAVIGTLGVAADSGILYEYFGSSWQSIGTPGVNYLPLTGGTLSGDLTISNLSGAGGGVVFVDSTGKMKTDQANFIYDSADVGLAIGGSSTFTPILGSSYNARLAIHSAVEGNGVEMFIQHHSDTATTGPQMFMGRTRGTESAKTTVHTGDTLSQIFGNGYAGSSYYYSTLVQSVCTDPSPSGTSMAGALQYLTTPVGSTTPVLGMTLDSTQTLTLVNVPVLPSQSVHTVLAAPSTGSGIPTFRTLVSGDLPTFGAAAAGIVPASGGGTTNFLRADGSWTTPGAGSGFNYLASGSSVYGGVGDTLTFIGVDNTVIGPSAGDSLTTGNDNTLLGYEAGNLLTTGAENTAVGSLALAASVNTTQNTAIGGYALTANTGNNNTAVGYDALVSNTSGTGCTAVGSYAASGSSTSSNVTAIGFGALYNATTGSASSIAIGAYAGWHVTTSNNELFVGVNQQANYANDKAYSLLYGTFATSAGTTTGQTLTINAATINLGGGFGSPATITLGTGGIYAQTAGTTGQVLTSAGAGNAATWSNLPTITVANGGTGNTSLTAYSVLCGGTTTTSAVQSVSGLGTTGQVLTSNGASALPTWKAVSATKPTIQVFTSGSGTYTAPAGVQYIKVKMIGGGGGGMGSGGSAGLGTNGTNTTFGTTFLVANAGGCPVGTLQSGPGGTAASLPGGAAGFSWSGSDGETGFYGNPSTLAATGAHGGSGPFGGAGVGGPIGTAGFAAKANSGAGGGGAAGISSGDSGAGGGSGNYVEALIASPSATYSYTVGAAGSGGTAGSGGYAGGAGGSGIIIVEEHYI